MRTLKSWNCHVAVALCLCLIAGKAKASSHDLIVKLTALRCASLEDIQVISTFRGMDILRVSALGYMLSANHPRQKNYQVIVLRNGPADQFNTVVKKLGSFKTYFIRSFAVIGPDTVVSSWKQVTTRGISATNVHITDAPSLASDFRLISEDKLLIYHRTDRDEILRVFKYGRKLQRKYDHLINNEDKFFGPQIDTGIIALKWRAGYKITPQETATRNGHYDSNIEYVSHQWPYTFEKKLNPTLINGAVLECYKQDVQMLKFRLVNKIDGSIVWRGYLSAESNKGVYVILHDFTLDKDRNIYALLDYWHTDDKKTEAHLVKFDSTGALRYNYPLPVEDFGGGLLIRRLIRKGAKMYVIRQSYAKDSDKISTSITKLVE